MARNYKFAEHRLKTVSAPGVNVFRLSSFDADQSPPAYAKSIKVSIIPNDQQTANPASFMVVASTSMDPADENDIFTAGATSDGGGIVWLHLRKRIRSSVQEDTRDDGPIYIHVYTQGFVAVRMQAEAWGKYLNIAAP